MRSYGRHDAHFDVGLHGVAGLEELRAAGWTRDGIKHAVRSGRLHRLHHGVYAIGRPDVGPLGHARAAILAIGDGAAASHRTAAAIHGRLPFLGAVDVSTTRRLKSRHGIRVHATGSLHWHDVLTIDGIPTTTPARTTLDLADVLDTSFLEKFVRRSLADRFVSEAALHAQIARAPTRRAASRLQAVLEGGAPATRSELEDRLLALLARHGLPRPLTNVRLPDVPGHPEVDVLFPAERVVIEADGLRFHDNVVARRQDRERQAAIEAAGYLVIRVTWTDLTSHETRTVARIRAALAR